MDRLRDRVAFITGAAMGIGRGSAVAFGSEGAKVIVADIDEKGGKETVEMIKEAGGEGKFVRTDVTDAQSVKKGLSAGVDAFGKLDILYNNAGGSVPDDGPITDISIEVWEKTHAVDLFGTFLCCKYGIPELIKNGGGSVILTASIAGLTGWKRSAYTAAKGGIVSLTRVMAVDYAKYNIRVNCLCPGVIITERAADQMRRYPEVGQQLRSLSLLGFGEPKDIAYAAIYLASDESKFVTGAIFSVDSGYTAVGRFDPGDLLQKE